MLTIEIVVAFIATASATVLEYNEADYLEDMEIAPGAEPIPALLINAEFTRVLERDIEEEINTATFNSVLLPIYNLQGHHPICRSSLGIDINNGQTTFCGMNVLDIHATETESTGTYTLTISFYFQVTSYSPFVLEVAVYKRRSLFEARGQEQQFKNWAAEEKVGISFPLSAKQLLDLRQDLSVAISYTWLRELLSMGIFKRTIQTIEGGFTDMEEPYASRPLVLPEDTVNELLNIALWHTCIDEDAPLPSTRIRPR